MAKDTFDPRFDPAFQPGFDGGTVQVSRPKTTRPASPAQAALEKRSASAEEPVVAEPDAEVEPVETSRRPNPFLIALAAVSVALIAGGLGAAQSVRGLFTTENISVDLDYISLEMIKFAAPLAVALGIATGIGVLFIYAIDWKKRHDQ